MPGRDSPARRNNSALRRQKKRLEKLYATTSDKLYTQEKKEKRKKAIVKKPVSHNTRRVFTLELTVGNECVHVHAGELSFL